MDTITIRTEKGVKIATLSGRVDATTYNTVDQALRPLAEGEKFLIIDLSLCNYLSSAGIRVLLVAAKKMAAKGDKLYLSGLLPEVFQVIEMAGLHQIFNLHENPDTALAEIERIGHRSRSIVEWEQKGHTFQFYPVGNKKQNGYFWKEQEIVGYNELEFAIGLGSIAETVNRPENPDGLFISTGHFAGFLPAESDLEPEFRVPQNPANAGIFVQQAISFGNSPTGMLQLSQASRIPFGQLADELLKLKNRLSDSGNTNIIAYLIANLNRENPTLTFCLPVELQLSDALDQLGLDELSKSVKSKIEQAGFLGIELGLDQLTDLQPALSLFDFLKQNLTVENINRIASVQPADVLVNPKVWVFRANEVNDGTHQRLCIETSGDFTLEPHKAFLVRRLYTDSAKISIKQIHGGYSAQTFQVTSYDYQQRKLRPTVLKIANRTIILRESERCQQYAHPYILNNSAMVLGTHFYGNTGALRYNFVGIGGEQTQLKWLTHYFNHWHADQLKPLFDKIFLQILHPWYGQPVEETIYPFADHDPRVTFFPGLCEIASELFGVSTDQPYFEVPEINQQIVNPYWFLKHEFPKFKNLGIDYLTAITHGDLNMQNILLDAEMNVYLIDFSETRPRSVVSDFARLEAIFMIEHAPLANDKEVEAYFELINSLYENLVPGSTLSVHYDGEERKKIEHITGLTQKMRDYAFLSARENPNPVPYCLALLEWTLPVVCYSSTSFNHKRLSMVLSGLICQIIIKNLDRNVIPSI